MAYCWTGKEKSGIRWNPQDVFVLGILFARHGRALTGESPEHAQIVGSV